MQATVVELFADEKKKIIEFIDNQQAHYSNKLETFKREFSILEKCKAETPKDAARSWVTDLEARIQDWSEKIIALTNTLNRYDAIVAKFYSTKEVSFKDSVSVLRPLYDSEHARKSVEPKYKYYPRLKIAREKSLYVFANKIKILMESEYVKIA